MTRASAALIVLVASLGLAITLQSASARAPGPEEAAARKTVQEMVDDALGVLEKKDASKQAKRRKLEAIAEKRFDFELISKLVLARSWRNMTEAQQAEFRVELEEHIAAIYGESLLRYSDEKLEVISARKESGGDVTVRSQILGEGKPIPVDYRLRARGTEWYVIDVTIEGLSQLQSLRSQARDIISREGPDGLIQTVRKKNAERNGKSPPGPPAEGEASPVAPAYAPSSDASGEGAASGDSKADGGAVQGESAQEEQPGSGPAGSEPGANGSTKTAATDGDAKPNAGSAEAGAAASGTVGGAATEPQTPPVAAAPAQPSPGSEDP